MSKLLSLSYLGSLDDVVDRYPWREGIIGHEELTAHLLNNFLYGKVGVINDGYLLANRLITSHYETARSRDRSLILNLVETGDLRVFTRSGQSFDLVKGLEDSANKGGVVHHKALMNSDVYEDTIRPALMSLSEKLTKKAIPFPSYHLGQAFYTLLLSLLDKDEKTLMYSRTNHKELEKALKFFEKERGNNKFESARGNWEDLCRIAVDRGMFEQGNDAFHELMEIANKCYHVAYGMGMSISSENAGSLQGLTIDSRVTTGFVNNIFDEFIEEDGLYEHAPSTGELCNLLMLFPDDFWMDDYSLLRRIGTKEEFLDLRQHYVNSLLLYCEGGRSFDDAEKEMINYRNFLVEEIGQEHFFGNKMNKMGRGMIEIFKAGAKGNLKKAAGAGYGWLVDAIFIIFKIKGIRVSDYMFRSIARNALQYQACSVQERREDIPKFLSSIGLTSPKLNKEKAHRFFEYNKIQDFS